MKARDLARVRLLRTTLAAIDNAEAVPSDQAAGAIEQASVGAGSTEARRLELTENAMRQVVEGEIAERRAAADAVGDTRPERASELREQADTLADLLAGSPT